MGLVIEIRGYDGKDEPFSCCTKLDQFDDADFDDGFFKKDLDFENPSPSFPVRSSLYMEQYGCPLFGGEPLLLNKWHICPPPLAGNSSPSIFQEISDIQTRALKASNCEDKFEFYWDEHLKNWLIRAKRNLGTVFFCLIPKCLCIKTCLIMDLDTEMRLEIPIYGDTMSATVVPNLKKRGV